MLLKTFVTASSVVLLQLQPNLLCSAYPTKEVLDLVDPGTKEGGDGGCEPSTHKYVQVDTINNLDKENSDYSVYFTQLTAECGQPFPPGYEPYSISGHFAPGDIEPDDLGRSQLNLYFCAPYGDYKIDIEVHGAFEYQEGKRIGWEIEDGKTQTHCWDTFNLPEYTNTEYNPTVPGSFSWPLPGETDEHMSRFYVSRTMTSPPADPECDDVVPVEQQPVGPDTSQVIETEVGVSGSSSDGGASVLIGAPEGCFEDKPGSRVFDIFSSGADVTVQSCANFCFYAGYPYMGVEFANECYCGESLPAPLVEISNLSCSMPCAGDSTALCGGRDAIMIYSLDGDAQGDGGGGAAEESTPPAAEESITAPPSGGGGGGGGGDDGSGTGSGETAAGSGCYKDAKGARVLTGTPIVKDDSMTHELCESLCTDAGGMGVYGVEHGHECFCGVAAPDEPEIADSFCDTPCAGNVSQNCGGYDAIKVVAM